MTRRLILESRSQVEGGIIGGGLFITPGIGDDYWSYRVRLTETQSILGFPKFSTIGIGFAQEKDWNTNLPYTCETEEIYRHIKHNRGDKSIKGKRVRKAIRLIQAAAAADRGEVS